MNITISACDKRKEALLKKFISYTKTQTFVVPIQNNLFLVDEGEVALYQSASIYIYQNQLLYIRKYNHMPKFEINVFLDTRNVLHQFLSCR